jgi:hypothetical protein
LEFQALKVRTSAQPCHLFIHRFYVIFISPQSASTKANSRSHAEVHAARFARALLGCCALEFDQRLLKQNAAENRAAITASNYRGTSLVSTPHKSGAESIRATLRGIRGQLSGDQWRRVSFYVGVPLLLGLYGAMNNFRDVPESGHIRYLMFFIGHAMIPFWISCLSTQLFTIILAPFRWPLVPRLVLGSLLAGVVVLPYANWLAAADAGSSGALNLLSQEFFIYSVRSALVWVGINLLFDRFLGLPRYRYPAVDIPGKSDIDTSVAASGSGEKVERQQQAMPAVLQLAPVPLKPEQLLAMCAEEHYVRLYTTEGEFLVYHRFSDALKEVKSLPGLRVHRSNWVAARAIVRICHSAKKNVRRDRRQWQFTG